MRMPTFLSGLPRRALLLNAGILTISVSSFMIVPLLALYLSVRMHTPAGQIGVVLAVMTITNQGLQVGIGVLADRYGQRLVLSLGILVACSGYLGFALRPDFAFQLLCGLLLGLGRGAIGLIAKTMVATEAGDKRAAALALRAVAVNGGAAVGPIIGGLLFDKFSLVLLVTVSIHMVFWLTTVRTLPAHSTAASRGSRLAEQLRSLPRNGQLVALACASIGFWYLYTQLTFTFPLYAEDRFHLAGKVGWLFAVNAVLAIVFQYTVTTSFNRRTDGWRTIATGCAILSASFLCLLIPAVWALVIFVVIFSFGELVVVPALDILTAEIATRTVVAGSFGFASLGWAAGGLLGSLLGGVWYQADERSGHFGPFWVANCLIGAVTALAFIMLGRRFGREETAQEPQQASAAGPGHAARDRHT